MAGVDLLVLGWGGVMEPATVALWRDVALVLLVAEAFILILPALVLLVYAFRGLRRARTALLPALTSAQGRTEQVEKGAHTFSSIIVNAIVRTLGAGAFVLEVLRALSRR